MRSSSSAARAARHVDLAECGAVEYADTATRCRAFTQHRGVYVLAGARVMTRTFPLPDVLEHRALRDMPVVQRRRALRVEQRATVAPCQRRERDGRVGRPKCRGAQRFNR